jgi:hypothetical protein
MGDPKKELADLAAEEERIRLRMKKRNEEQRKDQHRLGEIGHQRRRLRLAELLNVPDGVQPRVRLPAGTKGAELNDLRGTLRSVRRTRVSVDFAGALWNFPLADIQAAGEPQGQTIPLG